MKVSLTPESKTKPAKLVHCTACIKYFGQCLVCGVDLGQIMQNKDSWPSKSELCRLERKIAFWEYSSRQYLENIQEVSLSLCHIYDLSHTGEFGKNDQNVHYQV